MAEKALWFSESFALKIDSITAHTSNTGESITLSLADHAGQESHYATNGSSTSSHAAVNEDSLQATLYLLERFGVSDERYRELIQVCCCNPSLTNS